MLILNEEKRALDLLMGNAGDIKGLKQRINLITRYNYHVKGLNSDDNYNQTIQWMNKHHKDFCESNYTLFITSSINKAPKLPFYKIDCLQITQRELNVIEELEDIRHKKILFVLLCCAKMQREAFGYTQGFTNYQLIEIYKMARITVPSEDREYLLYQLKAKGLIRKPQKNDSNGLFVTFLSGDDADDVYLRINESECQDLGYYYLSFIHNGDGYKRCPRCGRVIKKIKNKTHCKDCSEELAAQSGNKTIWCIDCGRELQISSKNTQTCRCEECYSIYRRRQKTEEMRKLRNK